MTDRRQKNSDWYTTDQSGRVLDRVYEGAILATLMDIRDELQAIRRRLDCRSTLEIPVLLQAIDRNTRKPRKRRRT